ncbi:MAG TPA: hypothetical protein VK779_07710 [Rhizomicrobium sp.]|jgi:hypothetical protein|nr:hypothetical protein [Rhizomicrobium sp.]
MTTRMTSKTVVFQHPFVLFGFEQIEPAGSYIVETEEEQIEDASVSAWRRTATIMHMNRGGATEYLRIEAADLTKALARDAGQQESPETTQARLDSERRSRNARLVRRKKF